MILICWCDSSPSLCSAEVTGDPSAPLRRPPLREHALQSGRVTRSGRLQLGRVAGLDLQFPGIRYFSLYLADDFGRFTYRMDQSFVGILCQLVVEFSEGFAQANMEVLLRSKDLFRLTMKMMPTHNNSSCMRKNLDPWWTQVEKRGQSTNGFFHQITKKVFTLENKRRPPTAPGVLCDRMLRMERLAWNMRCSSIPNCLYRAVLAATFLAGEPGARS